MPPSRKPVRSKNPGDQPPRTKTKYSRKPPTRAPSRRGAARGEPLIAEGQRAPRTIGGGVRIVHEDSALIVLDKPAGLLTSDPREPDKESVFRLLKDYAREKSRRRGVRAWIIHRLDREASGLLVFAKNETAFHWLKEDFKAKRARRLYTAVVEGELKEGDTGTIQAMLVEGEDGVMRAVQTQAQARRLAPDDEERSLHATTHYRVMRSAHGRSLIQVRLETGRKNQIRAHMQHIGHPIVGDRRYGAATDPLGRVCLHASELGFTHPATGRELRFTSHPPGSFGMLVGGPSIPGLHGSDGYSAMPIGGPAQGDEAEKSTKTNPTPHERGDQFSSTQTGWDHVAQWYDELLEGRRSDHYDKVIIPGAMRLLQPGLGQRVLDVACGQGMLCRAIAASGAHAVGVDASARLIASAQRAGSGCEYVVGDARELERMDLGAAFDSASCVMAIMNIEPMSPVLRGVAGKLRSGGALVLVLLHPAFRAPGQTSWGWEGEGKQAKQYRRVDAYLSASRRDIVMNPGAHSSGAKGVTTQTYHRPIQTYVRELSEAGLLVNALEEWPSARISQPGPRAAEENRARREVPMFLAIRAVKA